MATSYALEIPITIFKLLYEKITASACRRDNSDFVFKEFEEGAGAWNAKQPGADEHNSDCADAEIQRSAGF
jgi:hypothetical protein